MIYIGNKSNARVAISYSAEAARSFKVSFREHVSIILTATTAAVGDQLKCSSHTLNMASSWIYAREDDIMFKRRIREAMVINCWALTLNRDAGYELPVIYRDVVSRDSQYKSGEKTPNSTNR